MSNEILFNSPALHALKRAQLIKLCRRYEIKVTGKNAELVAKLQQHAVTLPPTTTVALPSDTGDTDMDGESDVTDEGEDRGEEEPPRVQQRESQQWELVEGELEDTFGQGSTTVHSDFGERFGAGKASSSLGSSIRAFASSLKRSQVRNPAPMEVDISQGTTLMVEDTAVLVENTSVSTIKPSTPKADPNVPSTIRLVQSQAAAPSPELPILPNLSAAFPPLPDGLASASPSSSSIYPRLPSEQEVSAEETEPDIPGSFTPTRVGVAAASHPPTFMFGSPKHAVSNDQFATAALSVLDELNRRVAAAGGKVLDNPTSRLSFTGSALESPSSKKLSRFETLHDKHFSKMDSIANHYAAKRGTPNTSAAPDSTTRIQKRKAVDEAKQTSVSAELPPEEAGPSAKRPRTSLYPQPRKLQLTEPVKDAQVVQVRDSAAQKRRLDQAKARRSSTGRRGSVGQSISGKRTISGSSSGNSLAGKSGATSRFGFLKSSARLVQRVFSAGDKSKPVPQSNLPRSAAPVPKMIETKATPLTGVPTPAPRSILLNADKPNVLSASQGSSSNAASTSIPKSTGYRQLSAMSSKSAPAPRAPSTRNASNSTARTASSQHRIPSVPSRKPLPSFDRARSPSVAQDPRGRTSRTASSSSATKENASQPAQSNNNSQNALAKRPSTLYAPTASSLARMQSTVRPPILSTVPEHNGLDKSSSTNMTFSNLSILRSPVPRMPATNPMSPLQVITNAHLETRSSPSKLAAKRKPRISRSVVIGKLHERRAAAAAATGLGAPPGKSRSSLAAKAYSRRSLGGAKHSALGISSPSAALEMQRVFKARQSEIARRKSRARASIAAK